MSEIQCGDFVTIGDCQMIYGDCIEVMPRFESVSVDAVIADPPYGTTACKWDTVIPFDKMWPELKRIIKPTGAIALFGSEPFSSLLRVSNIKDFKYDWVWEKPSGANFLNFAYQPSKVHELISVFSESAASYSKKSKITYYPQMTIGESYVCTSGKQKTEKSNLSVRSAIEQVKTVNAGTRYPRSIFKYAKDKGETLHPAQKPVALMEYLIKTYTEEGDIVFDFAMGSGTTAIACINTNRCFVGIEKDLDTFNIACTRVRQRYV